MGTRYPSASIPSPMIPGERLPLLLPHPVKSLRAKSARIGQGAGRASPTVVWIVFQAGDTRESAHSST